MSINEWHLIKMYHFNKTGKMRKHDSQDFKGWDTDYYWNEWTKWTVRLYGELFSCTGATWVDEPDVFRHVNPSYPFYYRLCRVVAWKRNFKNVQGKTLRIVDLSNLKSIIWMSYWCIFSCFVRLFVYILCEINCISPTQSDPQQLLFLTWTHGPWSSDFLSPHTSFDVGFSRKQEMLSWKCTCTSNINCSICGRFKVMCKNRKQWEGLTLLFEKYLLK